VKKAAEDVVNGVVRGGLLESALKIADKFSLTELSRELRTVSEVLHGN